ncbi:MAG TPA: methyltransferase domain-containing protein [Candidatus Binataceae bacterium]|jgi:phosphatidylethanolamine/phosphatidyl-N-methylethanolamine N-methyltransferase|nr:methyltransferase domain-containing protein [Candidatus Binataceae bacterium]
MGEPHQSRVYSDLARFYDHTFGRIFVDHEHEIIEQLNLRPDQQVLEVGVGTGISLDAYPPYVKVVGIDPSADMLAHAIKKTRDNGWGHIDVRQGDALHLEFPDNSFDWVTTFHVMSVVPDPLRMMQEMLRVCKPGGKIVLINHFASENPLLYSLVWIANPLTKHLGWTTRLQVRDVIDGHQISVERNERISRTSFHRVVIATKLAA